MLQWVIYSPIMYFFHSTPHMISQPPTYSLLQHYTESNLKAGTVDSMGYSALTLHFKHLVH